MNYLYRPTFRKNIRIFMLYYLHCKFFQLFEDFCFFYYQMSSRKFYDFSKQPFNNWKQIFIPYAEKRLNVRYRFHDYELIYIDISLLRKASCRLTLCTWNMPEVLTQTLILPTRYINCTGHEYLCILTLCTIKWRHPSLKRG